MKCKNCGSENSDSSKFCATCGKPLKEEESSTLKSKLKNLNKLQIALACAVVAVVIVSGLLISRASRTINLNEYISFETEGYNGYGNVYPEIDWQKIQEKYDSKVKFTDAFKEQFGEVTDAVSPIEVLQSYVSVDVESDGNLSNKDKVRYVWNINKEYSKYVKCNLKYKDKTYTVTGLEDVEKFDAFQDLEVSFKGADSEGSVSLEYTGSDLTADDFQTDATNGTLKNGDTIKVYLDESMADSYAESFGKVPEEWEKEYTVEGLYAYISSVEDIDDESMQKLQDQAVKEYKDHVDSSWTDSESLQSLTYMGSYLLKPKTGKGNELYLIYHAKVRDQYSNSDGSYDQVNDVYWYMHYGPVMADDEGNTQVDLSDYGTPGNFFKIKTNTKTNGISSMVWKYYGYPTLDDLYADVVTKNQKDYDVEDSVDSTK